MVHLSEEQLRQLQRIELELLIEIDRICKKCDIHYNIIAGTQLGAVRHGGFIPWDDDADVAMLRPEYERFRQAMKTELDETRFYFQDHVCTPGYRWGYGKLRRKETLFLREFQEAMPYEQGVFVDVFPLDSVPENYVSRSLVNFSCFCIRKALWSEVGKVAEKNPVKKAAYRLLSKIPLPRVLKLYEQLIEKSKTWSSSWVRILLFPTPNREWGYRRKWYTSSQEILFEGVPFQGVADPTEYLQFKYGNYNEIPPEDQREIHPVSQLRLTEPRL